MKKESKSYNLFKIAFVAVVFIAILSWIIPTGAFENGKYVSYGLVRTSIYDFIMTYYYAILYLLVEVVFLVCVGGFYGVISQSREYSIIVTSISKKIKGRENIFMIVIGSIFALFTSINIHFLFCLAFIPFIINILSMNKINKYKIFATTFGSMMIGLLGSTFSQYYGKILVDVMPITLSDGLIWKLVVLGVSFFIMMSFVLTKSNDSKFENQDIFSLVEVEKKCKTLPVIIVLTIFAILSICLFTPWKEAFGIEFFDNFYNKIMAFKINDHEIISYLFNKDLSIYPYGSYDKLLDMVILMVFTSFIVSFLSKMKINYYLRCFGDGVKKILKPVAIFLLVNCSFVIAYWSPMGPTIVNKLAPLSSNFNIFILIIIALILAIINADHGYTLYSVGTYLGTLYVTRVVETVLVLNTIYGVIQFIVPSSYLLFFALSYFDISYKEYLKNMWKFLLALTIAMIFVLLMAVYL